MDGSYLRKANKYIADVLSEKVPACKWVKLACERQKRDLANSRGRGSKFRYKFDKDKAERVCAFIELLPHIKGEWANRRETFKLEPWQCFILTTIFGWVDKKTGRRRFRTAYTEIPRKNAKSSLSSGVALYMLGADGESGAEVYAAATKKEQARIVFDDARAMVNKSSGLRSELGIDSTKYSIFQEDSNSSFRALVRDQQGNLDGLNIHAAIVDELHGHKDRGTWDVLVSGTGARSQPLIWAITTAGFNRGGICYQQRTYATKILENAGGFDDENFFAIIYTIDDGDDWREKSSWIKANPNWGISVDPDQIEAAAKKAITMSSEQNNFLTKHLDVWVNADSAWMNMNAWDKCADPSLDISEFTNDECILAADLAYKNDFTSVAKLFKRKIDNKDHYYAFVRHYTNEDAADANPQDQIPSWAEDGYCEITEGSVTDFSIIEEDIKQDAREFRGIKNFCFDPAHAAQMLQNLQAAGLPCIEYTNNLKNMSEPTKELEALVLAGRFHHNGDPVLTWMVSNVVGHLDAKGNIFAKRDRTMPHAKIDGAIAVIMAIGRYLQAKPPEPKFQMFTLKR